MIFVRRLSAGRLPGVSAAGRRPWLKVLFFDRSGLALLYKRLEQGSFQLPTVDDDEASVEIDPGQLAMILEGIDLRSAVRRKRYRHPRRAPAHC